MYSKSPENSFKVCDCLNNNNQSSSSSQEMKKSSGGEDGGHKNGLSKLYCNGIQKKSPQTVEIRREEVLAIRSRFPSKIPVIVQRYIKENHLPQLDKAKFLVPQEITMSQFQTIIRNRIRLNSNQALYLLVNNKTMMSQSLTLAEVYAEHADADGFLYITYASQEVFGHAPSPAHEEGYQKNQII